MKIFFVLVNVALAVSQVPTNSANAWANLVSQYKTECLCATNADPAVVEKWLFNYAFPNDACLMCFIKCVSTKLGLLNPDGSVNVEANNALVSQIPGSSSNFTSYCTNQTLNTIDICKRAFEYSLCYQTALVKGARN